MIKQNKTLKIKFDSFFVHFYTDMKQIKKYIF